MDVTLQSAKLVQDRNLKSPRPCEYQKRMQHMPQAAP